MKKFFTQVIGLGPAGLGLALAADTAGLLTNLLLRGVIWLDQQSIGNGGRIGGYKIVSNSPVGDYLETISPNGLFAPVRDSPIGKWFSDQDQHSQIHLSRVGELAGEAQNQLARIITDFCQSEILTGVGIDSVRWNGTEFVSYSGDTPIATSAKLVLACGAREQKLPVLDCLGDKLILSSDVISDRAMCGENIYIIGVSHSMASVLWKLREQGKDKQITVYHRSSVKFFYPSVADAIADGYNFTMDDVCPLTGRVHRFGGIRSPYRELVQNAVRDGWVKFERITSLEPVIPTLSRADTVVQATGFRASRVPIVGMYGGPLMTGNGHLVVDKNCNVYCQCGCGVIKGAYALGLGHKPPPAPELGGEPSYNGPVDGFNLYAGTVGRTVLKGLLKEE